jgi:hypothetical protein
MGVGLVLVAAVFLFFAIGGLGGGSGLLIGLAVFVLPTMFWMLDLMRQNDHPEPPAMRQTRR